jgi:prepilin-type N-terminal cleavage/methylation domain-containing protein
MSFNNIKTNLRSEKGFTIVELLIVIVVIGILAAITIVSFNGVTARANTTSAQASAAAVLKKSELYNAENSRYPILSSELTSALPTDTFFLTGVSFTAGFANPSSANGKTTVLFLKCAAAGPANQAAVLATNITGVRVLYYNFSTGLTVAQDTGATVNCPTS